MYGHKILADKQVRTYTKFRNYNDFPDVSRNTPEKLLNWDKNNSVYYSSIKLHKNWAASWQNQHNGFATSMDPDQPAHLRSLIRIHAVRLPTLLQVQKLIANSMDPDQTALVWIHAGRKRTMLVLSWHGSNYTYETKFLQCNKFLIMHITFTWKTGNRKILDKYIFFFKNISIT
jgi:hypothetical protein